MSMTSSQPYLLRAIYEWIVDNDMTPYVLVNAGMENTHVPRQYVENGKIVLNLAPVFLARAWKSVFQLMRH